MHVEDGVPKMVQIYKDRDPLDALATRTSMKVVRTLFAAAPRAKTSSQLAEGLETSRSGIHRALTRLEVLGLVRSESRGMLVLHGIRSSSPLVGPLFEMFNQERYISVRPKIREALERIMRGIDASDLSCVVL
ncbi:MAG: helix-turn-helix transcriptional regulator, partial [Planctomycetes bacterium]|nr:helix-turn-helix transcriptional regulator [Planctomycetota bacterium]